MAENAEPTNTNAAGDAGAASTEYIKLKVVGQVCFNIFWNL